MRMRKRMAGVLFLAIVVLGCSAVNVRASEPDPKFFNPAQEKRIKRLEERVAVLESALLPKPAPEQMPAPREVKPKAKVKAATQPATNALGAVIEPAPDGKEWVKAGGVDSSAPWELRDIAPTQSFTLPAQSAPAVTFPTPIRSMILNQTGIVVGGSTCPGGQCKYQTQQAAPAIIYAR